MQQAIYAWVRPLPAALAVRAPITLVSSLSSQIMDSLNPRGVHLGRLLSVPRTAHDTNRRSTVFAGT